MVDVGNYLAAVDRNGAGTNVIHLLPHGRIRERVFGSENRPPTPNELERMKGLVRKGLDEGAWGLSTGLWYVPGSYASTEEVVELARIVRKSGGLYASHMGRRKGGIRRHPFSSVGGCKNRTALKWR